ncbi:MAG: uridine kinase [Planctomycetes bacterium]|nr:uridine kinase [Planctomycetota bacterium]
MNHQQHILIGIAGGSGSGKTMISSRIVEEYGPEHVAVIELDSYYRDLSHLDLTARRAVNFDHPDAFDVDLLVEHLHHLRARESIDVPVYDYVNHNRKNVVQRIDGPPIVVLEGILAFYFRRVRELMDIKIFVDTPDDIRLLRRIRRDMLERGRDLQGILDQYEHLVRPMHQTFVEPSKREADIIVPRGGENTIAIEIIRAKVEKLLRGMKSVAEHRHAQAARRPQQALEGEAAV